VRKIAYKDAASLESTKKLKLEFDQPDALEIKRVNNKWVDFFYFESKMLV